MLENHRFVSQPPPFYHHPLPSHHQGPPPVSSPPAVTHRPGESSPPAAAAPPPPRPSWTTPRTIMMSGGPAGPTPGGPLPPSAAAAAHHPSSHPHQQLPQPPRQIRFVSNDGQPHAKRRRINAACKTCRKRKTRCSGERPTCETCRQNGHACMGYTEPQQEKGNSAPDKQQQHQQHQPHPPHGPQGSPEGHSDGDEHDLEHDESTTNNSFSQDARHSPNDQHSPITEHRPSIAQMKKGPSASNTPATSTSTPTQLPHHPHAHPGHHLPQTANTVPIQLPPESMGEYAATQGVPAPPPPADYADEEQSPLTKSSPLTAEAEGHRVPYFRYFGPTAIVPGFKQMVVQVKEHRRSTGASSSQVDSPSSPFGGQSTSGALFGSAVRTPSQSGTEPRSSCLEIPFYDPKALMPNSNLITHLVETFFIHLGCNFPFLQRERFQRDVQEKKVDAILVDAVCAMAARFSTHPLLTSANRPFGEESQPPASSDSGTGVAKSEYGAAFAQRAKDAIARTFSCPSVAVVQACLLLAYEEFGSNHDSGLWMYLGIAIRMAQDLGMNKLEGFRYEGRGGPTPKSAKSGDPNKIELDNEIKDEDQESNLPSPRKEAQKAAEKERVDTFWAVFFLDRVISSGTGRSVTLRDKDVELSFPSQDEIDSQTGSPAPFSALIRIIHLYGRVTDLLNGIKEITNVTPDTLKKLAGMERDLTGIYQQLSPSLHFNVANFQLHCKAQQGTNFILLHFWFHTLIVLLHQPTLLHSFKGRIQQLFPNSRELSMSSAKTIADILAFAELLDAKSFIGNPFTSQPMYIAACAFLMESAAHTGSETSSRDATPPPASSSSSAPRSAPEMKDRPPYPNGNQPVGRTRTAMTSKASADSKASKHSLLATAANQNYQRCYKALKALETYWAGTKYIITVLDQKMKGIGDPLLYTTEEMEASLEAPNPEPAFTTPGWRRKPSLGLPAQIPPSFPGFGNLPGFGPFNSFRRQEENGGEGIDPAQAIAFSLTGTTNSPNSNLTFLYQTSNGDNHGEQPGAIPPGYSNLPVEASSRPGGTSTLRSPSVAHSERSQMTYPGQAGRPPYVPAPGPAGQPGQQTMGNVSSPSAPRGMHPHASHAARHAPVKFSPPGPGQGSAEESMMLMNSPYTTHSVHSNQSGNNNRSTTYDDSRRGEYDYVDTSQAAGAAAPQTMGGGYYPLLPPGSNANANANAGANGMYYHPGQGMGDMMIESQDVDMNSLGEMVAPWMAYLPQDMMYFNGPDAAGAGQGPGQGGPQGEQGG